jgi:hypothetical protein
MHHLCCKSNLHHLCCKTNRSTGDAHHRMALKTDIILWLRSRRKSAQEFSVPVLKAVAALHSYQDLQSNWQM